MDSIYPNYVDMRNSVKQWTEQQEPKITHVSNISITVRDMERMIEFYRDTLGLKITKGPIILSGPEISRVFQIPGTKLQVIFLSVSGDVVELLKFISPPTYPRKPMLPNTVGAWHITFQTNDITGMVEQLKRKGVKFLSPVVTIQQEGLKGRKFVFFKDPEGNLLGLGEN